MICTASINASGQDSHEGIAVVEVRCLRAALAVPLNAESSPSF